MGGWEERINEWVNGWMDGSWMSIVMLKYHKRGRGGSRAGGGLGGAISIFSCEKFLDTTVCYRKHWHLGGNGLLDLPLNGGR